MELRDIALLVFSLVLGGFGWYLRAYVAKKAEHLATREDFLKLLKLQKQTTKEIEAIRSDISHSDWLKRRRWELRRETYGRLLTEIFRQQAMDGIRLAEVKTAKGGHMTEEQFASFEKNRQKQWQTALEHNEVIMTARFLVSPEAEKAIDEYFNRLLKLMQMKPVPENIAEIIEFEQNIKADFFAKLLRVAREEFGEEQVPKPVEVDPG